MLYIYEDPESPEKGYFVTQNTPAVGGDLIDISTEFDRDRIYISTEHSQDPNRARLVAVDVTINNNNERVTAEIKEAWHYEFGGPSGASPLRIGDTIYFDGDTGKRDNISGPQINDNGQVVWYSYDGTNYDVFFYSDGEPVPTPDPNDDVDPQINQGGCVVWCKEVWCGDGRKEYEIFRWDNSGVPEQISKDFYDDYPDHRILSNFAPRINDNGHVVWYGYDSKDGDYEVFVWNGGQTLHTLNDYDDVTPQINDNGQVVWCRHNGTDSEIFLLDITNLDTNPAPKPIELSTNSLYNFAPQINDNDNGQVVWCGYDPQSKKLNIYLYFW
jgi:hypothetical protein